MTAAQAAPGAVRAEWRGHWPMVLCAALGMGGPAIGSYALGQFFAPLEAEFGWTRTQVQGGMSFAMILGFLLAPVVGRLADVVSARVLAIPSLVLAGLALAAMSLATESVALWTGMWAAFYLFAAFAGPPVWLAALNHQFVAGRNLAIAVALCGMSIVAALGPISTRWLIDSQGWRMAFLLLALIWMGPPVVLSLLFFRDRRPLGRNKPLGDDAAKAAERPPLTSVYLSLTFLRLAFAVLASISIVSAFILHMAPALAGKGFDMTTAAAIAGSGGLIAIPAKLFAGSLFDRFSAPTVWIGFQGLLVIACVLLALPGASMPINVAGAWGLFICGGGMNVAVACIVARYFSGAVFGAVYGAMMALMAISAAGGPLFASIVHDATGSYAAALWGATGLAVLSGLALIGMRPLKV